MLLPHFENALVVVHTRVGREPTEDEPWLANDSDDEDDEIEKTYLLPRIAKHSYSFLPDCLDCRQWSIVLQAQEGTIHLFAFPLGWTEPNADIDELRDNEAESDPPFYLTSKLVLPAGASIRDVGFYSDDGKSSLSSGNDSGTGKEGRQKVGILLEESKQLELLLVKYDNLLWQAVPYESILIHPSEVEENCSGSVVAIPEGVDEEELEPEDSVVYAQCKYCCDLYWLGRIKAFSISNLPPYSARIVGVSDDSMDPTFSKLWLSGSRGVGGVARMSQGITFLELLDLEEDEFEDDEEEEDDDHDED